ncbi:MAG: helix-turn-helix transcriptional regulator [Gemmatimonadales bacterium]
MSKSLGEFEQLLLFALLQLPEAEAYGVPIRDLVERRTGRTLSAGAVYTALDRLQEKGLVSSHESDPTPERGGRRKRLYRLEPAGARALARAVETFQAMSHGLLPRLESVVAGHGHPGGRRA